jgi:hypothetical protein
MNDKLLVKKFILYFWDNTDGRSVQNFHAGIFVMRTAYHVAMTLDQLALNQGCREEEWGGFPSSYTSY